MMINNTIIQLKKWSLALLASSTLILSSTSHAAMLNAYIGTYSPHGDGIYFAQVNDKNGEIQKIRLAAKVKNAAQLVYHAKNKTLYVASEIDNYQDTKNGVIIAYRVHNDGQLTELNQVNSEGAGSVYLSITPSGSHLLIANYISGSIAIFPIKQSGELSPAVAIKQSTGTPGFNFPKAAAPGSFAISDHDGPHAHMIASDPTGKFIFSTDLGLDRIYQWKFNEKSGQLTPNEPAFIQASSEGAGPRHFVFHPNGSTLYLINEESSTLTVYSFNKKTGTLTERMSISSLPEKFKGTSYASGILISKDGKSLYVANRLHNSISQFAIDKDSNIKLVNNIWTRGDYTRTINFSPDGKYIYAMNQRSDNIVRFAVDSKGKLTFVDQYTAVGSPSQMVFAQ